ncbi:hypothetical protein POM88_035316 [Heracleum sosnowskyi]|uniref:Uncharacterized protein n=1 Tax=Heracleum sosnowskyi TaxID=360622 RepID=A0AAD8HMU2_9APIA|nr:hypothetical protein POM88_035316 [Heracleum sosnowskyi]
MAQGNMESWVGKDKLVVQTMIKPSRSDFYMVNLRDNKVTKLGGGFLWNHNIRYGLIAAGSVIYAIGNRRNKIEKPVDVDDDDDVNHFQSGTSFLDLDDPNGSWKDLGGMLNCDRRSPCCASLGDKIFVFRADIGTPLWCFGEYYDKKDACWLPVPMSGIKHQLNIDTHIISDPDHNRLLAYFHSSLYAYYPEDKHRWDCLDNNMLSWSGEPAPSPVDGVLYFLIYNPETFNDCITAYDLRTRESLEVSWSSSSPFGPEILHQLRVSQMLHLGGNILCFTHTQFGDEDPTHPPPRRKSLWEYYRARWLTVDCWSCSSILCGGSLLIAGVQE